MMIFVLTVCRISNVLLCNVTDRVSFWFVVTDSSKNVTTVPGSEVEAAIRYSHCSAMFSSLSTEDIFSLWAFYEWALCLFKDELIQVAKTLRAQYSLMNVRLEDI